MEGGLCNAGLCLHDHRQLYTHGDRCVERNIISPQFPVCICHLDPVAEDILLLMHRRNVSNSQMGIYQRKGQVKASFFTLGCGLTKVLNGCIIPTSSY